jgi:DNA (cytosine-5)-methyltransferase 1
VGQLGLPIDPIIKSPNFSDELCGLLGHEVDVWPDAFGAAISKVTLKAPIKALSLFAGAGGLDIGFHDAGFQIIEAVEIDGRFVATLTANSGARGCLGKTRPICTDIREYEPSPDLKVDLIIGGPPCQTFSAAGRRASGVKGTEDPRGMLFMEYVRILQTLEPEAFVFENVYGIVGAQGGEPWKEICASFHEIGYELHWRVLDAADYGVPQHRERLIIVGTKSQKFSFPRPTHGPDSFGNVPFYTAGAAVQGASGPGQGDGLSGRYGDLLEEIPPGLNYSYFTARMGHPEPVFAWRSKFSDFLYKADPEMPVRTIKAQGGQYTGPFSWENRPFSVAELKRLQTFPDAYEVLGGRGTAIHQIGNSVPPQLARVLALSIREQVFGRSIPIALSYLEAEEVLGFRSRKRDLSKAYQEKARRAIESRGRSQSLSAKRLPNSVERWADSGFAWSPFPIESGQPYKVRLKRLKKKWGAEVSSNASSVASKFRLIVRHSGAGDWLLPIDQLEASGDKLDFLSLFAAWRSLGELVSSETAIADLVQLSGYYQYQSALECRLDVYSPDEMTKEWRAIQQVVSGAGVGVTCAPEVLLEAWGIEDIDIADVREVLLSLRSAGYEVRSHRTNPQIQSGMYLIPYSFATLTPSSVQLKKSL